MTDDLKRVFGDLAYQIPSKPGDTFKDEAFDFIQGILPAPSSHMRTERLFINKIIYRYSGRYTVDSLWFHAHHETYRHLALLILSAMFHEHDVPIRLDLTHPSSDIKHIMLDYDFRKYSWRMLYSSRPLLVRYYPAPLDVGLQLGGGPYPLQLEDRPGFRLTNLEDSVSTDDEYQSRDAVWLEGNDRALALLADLLLNVGRLEEQVGMHEIEGSGLEGGSLGMWSAEVRLILPGHYYLREKEWPDEQAKTAWQNYP